MTPEKVKAVEAEIKRVQERIKAWRATETKHTLYDGTSTYTRHGAKEGGALRRASMDLTRALADLRRFSA